MQDYNRMKGEGDPLILTTTEDLADRAGKHLTSLGYDVI